MYGGDPYKEKLPDVAHVARLFWEHGVRVLAIQCDQYKDSILTPGGAEDYDHLSNGGVYFYPTTYMVSPTGLRRIEYGGRKDDGLGGVEHVGWSKVIFHKKIAPLIKAHLVLGGGAITRDDCDSSLEANPPVPIWYARMEAKYKPITVGSDPFYGEVHDWMIFRKYADDTQRGAPIWITGREGHP
mmetsp:Transcript_8541/g.27893  ORF Transcript_8541/g.27893 Transcript_8541/m.27893 type:complete len:185 (+) Transcript_8541:464-1018(+)